MSRPVDLLIRDTWLLRMLPGEPALAHQDLVIDGELILASGPTGSLEFEPRRILDGRQRLTMPGMINTHTHTGQAYMKGTSECMSLGPWLEFNGRFIRHMSSEDVHWAALLSIVEMIQAGITTFADMFFYEDAVAEAVASSGVRALLAQGFQLPNDDADPGNLADRTLEASLDFAERWNGGAGGRISTRLGPHTLYTLTEDLLKEAGRLAVDTHLGVHTHVSETLIEVETCRADYGVTPPQMFARWGYLEAPFLAAHCVHLQGDDIDVLDRPGVGVAHNPSSNLKLASGRADLPALVERRGLAVGLGTDSASSNDSLDLLKEVNLAALLHDWESGTPAARICLELATCEGARALGLEQKVGTLEDGKQADVILIDLQGPRYTPLHRVENSLVYAGRGSDVSSVIIAGKRIMEDRSLLTVDVDQVLRQARARAPEVF
jgi:5-methylthioadenosine/S-adenosylhomocysteine deaminase